MTSLPPGLFDQLADELAARQAIIRGLQKPLNQFGYDLVDTPLIEQADLFLIKAGDAAINRLVTFDLPGRTLCLRPEFTVPAARLYIEHFQDRPGAVRLQFAGPIVQYERLGHSHIWQQNAVGAELLNERGPAADAEVIALAGKMLDESGVHNWQLVIGHSGLVGRFLDRYDLNRQMRRLVLEQLPILRAGSEGYAQARTAIGSQLLPINDTSLAPSNGWQPDAESVLQALLQAAPQRGPSGGRTREEIARRLLSKQQQTDQRAGALAALEDFWAIVERIHTPAEIAHAVDDAPLQAIAAELADTFERLARYGIPTERISFDLTFTRNLDYYTGIVFEYRTPPDAGGFLLTGGGRYDELIRLLGAKRDVPAVGLMTYVERLRQAREKQP